MNSLTTFGPVKEIASLTLDCIYRLREANVPLREVEGFEDRWLSLVCTPGGSEFPSRSSLSSDTDNMPCE